MSTGIQNRVLEKEKNMTATKAVKAPTIQEKIKALQAQMLKEAVDAPEVIALANAMFTKTVAWAEETGLTTKQLTAPSAKSIEIGKEIDRLFENGPKTNSSKRRFEETEFQTIKELLEAVIGEEIPVTKLKSVSAKMTFRDGTAIILVKNKGKNAYPLNEVVAVVDADHLSGIVSNGTIPSDGKGSGHYFDPYPESITVPSEAQILGFLANLYVINPAEFDKLVKLAK
jgi:hypothetical protein